MELILGGDLSELIRTTGYIGMFAIVFAESGLFIGFFLPGDSLLFTAGFLASQGYLNIAILSLITFIGAVFGDSVGYFFGQRIGPKIFTREDSLFFHKDHIRRAEAFYERYGARAVVLARFMPIVRTFAPIVAGVGNMKYRVFIFYNILGGFLWAVGLTWAGYLLGKTIPGVDRYLFLIIGLIILTSVLPPLFHVLKNRSHREHMINSFTAFLRNIVRR